MEKLVGLPVSLSIFLPCLQGRCRAAPEPLRVQVAKDDPKMAQTPAHNQAASSCCFLTPSPGGSTLLSGGDTPRAPPAQESLSGFFQITRYTVGFAALAADVIRSEAVTWGDFTLNCYCFMKWDCSRQAVELRRPAV